MKIDRDEPTTGTSNRTERDKIEPLFTTQTNLEPEMLPDASSSEGWAWNSDAHTNTWTVQLAAMKVVTVPFAMLDAKGDGVFTYFFNHQYLPMDGDGEEDDLSPANFDQKIAAFMQRYSQYFRAGVPIAGRTRIMSAARAADARFLREFPDPSDRPDRARIVFTDGDLDDSDEFRAYLRESRVSDHDPTMGVHGNGDHSWNEKWAVAILGEPNGGATDTYKTYQAIQADHPWVHPVNFEGVKHGPEIGEDMAFMTVPTQASAA